MTDAWADAAAAASGAAARFRDGLARGAESSGANSRRCSASWTCEYGERYGFRDIRDADDDYRARVPIVTEVPARQGSTGRRPPARARWRPTPVVAFELTGGSAGRAKARCRTRSGRWGSSSAPSRPDGSYGWPPGGSPAARHRAISPVGRAPAALPSGIPLGLRLQHRAISARASARRSRARSRSWAVSALARFRRVAVRDPRLQLSPPAISRSSRSGARASSPSCSPRSSGSCGRRRAVRGGRGGMLRPVVRRGGRGPRIGSTGRPGARA